MWNILLPVACKVSKDADSLYFYARASKNIPAVSRTVPTDFMSVLLNADMDYTTGWEGYDYRISYKNGAPWLMRWDGDASEWKQLDQVKCVKKNTEIMYAVAKSSLQMTKDVDFDFKWVDNTPLLTTEILDFIPNGDCAPNGRFNYRYKGSALPTAVTSIPESQKPENIIHVYSVQGTLAATIRGKFNPEILNGLGLPKGSYVAKIGWGAKAKTHKFAIR